MWSITGRRLGRLAGRISLMAFVFSLFDQGKRGILAGRFDRGLLVDYLRCF